MLQTKEVACCWQRGLMEKLNKMSEGVQWLKFNPLGELCSQAMITCQRVLKDLKLDQMKTLWTWFVYCLICQASTYYTNISSKTFQSKISIKSSCWWCIQVWVLSVCKCGRRWCARLDQYCKMIVSGNPPQKTNTAHKMSTKGFYGLGESLDFILDKFLNVNKVERKVSLWNCLILWERHFRSGFASLFCLFIVLLLLLRHLIQFNASISVHNTRAQNILLFGDTSAKIPVPTQDRKKQLQRFQDWYDGWAQVEVLGGQRGESVH